MSPYSTTEVDGSSVVQVTVAEVAAGTTAGPDEIEGGAGGAVVNVASALCVGPFPATSLDDTR